MPILAGLLGSGFAAVVAWLTAYVGKKAAIGITLTAALVALGAALLVTFNALLTGIQAAVPSEMALGLAFLPDNTTGCLAALAAARAARWVFDWNVTLARDIAKI